MRSEEHTSELQSQFHLVDPHYFPTRRSSDLTSGRGQVKALRLHFTFNAKTVNRNGQGGTWCVVVTEPNSNTSWSYDSRSEPDEEDFWSPEIVGNFVNEIGRAHV